jgi:hypothetical protein
MNKQEFEAIVCDSITNEEFEVIQYVYNFHPCISEVRGKKEIAELYKKFGLRVIKDMTETAKKADELEQLIHDYEYKLQQLKIEYQDLKEGVK